MLIDKYLDSDKYSLYDVVKLCREETYGGIEGFISLSYDDNGKKWDFEDGATYNPKNGKWIIVDELD